MSKLIQLVRAAFRSLTRKQEPSQSRYWSDLNAKSTLDMLRKVNDVTQPSLSQVQAPPVHQTVLAGSVELARKRRLPASSDSKHRGAE